MQIINAYYYYVNDSPIGNIVFYATDNQNAEDKFRRLVARKLQSNSYVNTSKYRIERYPYGKLHHTDYQMITRLPEKIKSVHINILNNPSNRNDQSGWYVLLQYNRTIGQDFFKNRLDAIQGFIQKPWTENECEKYLLHKHYTVNGPFKTGIKMKIKPNKIQEPTLFEVKNIIKEETSNIASLLNEEINTAKKYVKFGGNECQIWERLGFRTHEREYIPGDNGYNIDYNAMTFNDFQKIREKRQLIQSILAAAINHYDDLMKCEPDARNKVIAAFIIDKISQDFINANIKG